MPVQPLKSITIAALAVGATGSEIRVSAASLGLICLLLNLCRFDSLMERIPIRIIHQVQLGLGVLLLLQGWRTLGSGTESVVVFAIVLSALFLLLPEWRDFLNGSFAVAGMVYVGAHSFMQGNPLRESLQKYGRAASLDCFRIGSSAACLDVHELCSWHPGSCKSLFS
ncbi:MAG: hypothetical protein IPL83_06165 [Bdellovibrionales bacterium]|nr:hypothetical protein [Bdellovibrionales bacterium]